MCTHLMYADFILLFYLFLLGQRWPNKELQTNTNSLRNNGKYYTALQQW